MKDIFKINNFDLIRLLAAVQVAFHHSLSHMQIENSHWAIVKLTGLFPGVPIFFFISGFLISKSFENNPDIKEYAQNRMFRIYPGLIVCTFLSVLSVYLIGYFSTISIGIARFLSWVIGQMTFFQFYNPEFMRKFGTGVLNGSLWTITVELQFYILIPVIYYFLKVFKFNKNYIITALIAIFLIINQLHGKYLTEYGGNILFKLWGVSFSPWLYMFLTGVLFQKNFEYILPRLRERFYLLFPVYVLTAYLSVKYLKFHIGNNINPVLFLILSCMIFSLAYSFPRLSNLILRKNDISYGVYIYHIPVVNIFMYLGYIQRMSYTVIAWVIIILLATISWILIEKPSMKRKKHPLNSMLMGELGAGNTG
jgi:peptidoglycan/LPS O-acetylase OafA/YrhL